MTPNQISELKEQAAAIDDVFGTHWQICEDFGDVSVRTEDSMPGFYTEVFRTSQLMGHDDASPLAEFLVNLVNRLPDLLTATVDMEADRDRARDAAVALEQENARLTEELGQARLDEQYEAMATARAFDDEEDPF